MPTLTIPNTVAPVNITGATVLTPDGLIPDSTVAIADGRITAVGAEVADGEAVDGTGLLLLPGIVDVHGDAFERAICPRPGVTLPLDLALAENDAWLLASGITTFFLSLTDSFEPGLRSRDTVRAVIATVRGPQHAAFGCDTRIHIRHEVCLTAGHDELLAWIAQGQVDLLSTADHLPAGDDAVTLERYRGNVRRRLSLSDTAIDAHIADALANRLQGHAQEAELCAAARAAGIAIASHDDATCEAVDAAMTRGMTLCEFPTTAAVAAHAQSRGAAVLMGAPNYVRGGSHVAALGVAEALAANVVDCLCSDYHYPSVFHAPFRMVVSGERILAEAWAMVSTNPARAAGVGDRKGRIAPGYDADLLLVDASGPLPRLRQVWAHGRAVAAFG